jgi:hypothetical protein
MFMLLFFTDMLWSLLWPSSGCPITIVQSVHKQLYLVCVFIYIYSMYACITPWWWHLHMSKQAQAMDGRSILSRTNKMFPFSEGPDGSETFLDCCPLSTGCCVLWDRMLTSRLHLAWRLRMSGAVPLLAILPSCCAQEQLCVELCQLVQVAVSF